MNKVILLGVVRSAIQIFETKTGALVGEVEFQTLEEEIHPQSGEPYLRAQEHRLLLSGRQLDQHRGLVTVGRELSIEGKLTYRKYRGMIRVSTIKPVAGESELPELKATHTGRRDLDFLASPAFAGAALQG